MSEQAGDRGRQHVRLCRAWVVGQEQFVHRAGGSRLSFEADAAGEVALGVEIDDEHTPVCEGERGGEIDGGGGLADPTFLVYDREDARRHRSDDQYKWLFPLNDRSAQAMHHREFGRNVYTAVFHVKQRPPRPAYGQSAVRLVEVSYAAGKASFDSMARLAPVPSPSGTERPSQRRRYAKGLRWTIITPE